MKSWESETYRSTCPSCKEIIAGPFRLECPHCLFNIRGLVGQGTSDFQRRKWDQHTDILQGRDVHLYDKDFNASFDYNGHVLMTDLVRFTISYGDRAELPSPRGNHYNPVILAYIPEIIGSGTAIHYTGTVPCSGVCLISPQSVDYSHSFPVIGMCQHKWDTFFENLV